MATKKLIWSDEYSVGVEEIDKQHQHLFMIINDLLDVINTRANINQLKGIINSLVEYKIFHFETEEKYFREFNYEETEDHIIKHREFNKGLETLKSKYPDYTAEFAFALVDFLEDWLVNHLMLVDQKYRKCFNDHGLK